MLERSRFCLNRMACPNLNLSEFFKLAGDVGLSKVELRNDLRDGRILDACSADEVKALSDQYGIGILTINAVQKFDLAAVHEQVTSTAQAMLEIASAIGCAGVILCPNNDPGDSRTPAVAFNETVAALKSLVPLFEQSGIIGLIEPLGFEECSLRSKDTALKAIATVGFDGYKLVHDTFHHFIGPDDVFHPLSTGLIHISGVEDDLPVQQYRDCHRGLIGPKDRLDNRSQIEALLSQGYAGDFSFEPFAVEVQRLSADALAAELMESLAYILDRVDSSNG